MKKEGGLISTARNINDIYHVQIIMRGFYRFPEDLDYHAIVSRIDDGVQIIFDSRWKWLLEYKIHPKILNYKFKQYDKRQKKSKEIEDLI